MKQSKLIKLFTAGGSIMFLGITGYNYYLEAVPDMIYSGVQTIIWTIYWAMVVLLSKMDQISEPPKNFKN